MQTARTLLSRRWWLPTLLVLLACAGLAWLGIWQLDRLEQRRAFNSHVAERWRQAPFLLTAASLPADLAELEYRRVQVEGVYDYDHQIVLTNQTRGNVAGVILVTPLVMADDKAVLVARGWVPYSQSTPDVVDQFTEQPAGPLVGLIQQSQTLPGGQPVAVPAAAQREWYYLGIDAIQPQMPYTLLPVFVLQLPEDGRPFDQLPFREEPLSLSEGSHLSYAVQWFMFAVILGFGYSQYVRLMERKVAPIVAVETSPASSGDGPSIQDRA